MPAEALTYATAALVGLAIAMFALLRAWHGWLELKRKELDMTLSPDQAQGLARIELADLRERGRRLEAIAEGVEL